MDPEMRRIPWTLLLSHTYPSSIFLKYHAQKNHVAGNHYLLSKVSLAGLSLIEKSKPEKFKNRLC